MSYPTDPFAHAVHTAEVWLRRITDDLATEDRAFAYRVLRAWLHTVRDRLEVIPAAHLSAQLPELLRGVYFEGWTPAKVPVSHHASLFLADFAAAAGVTEDEAQGLAWLITDALRELFSPGQLDHVAAVLPAELRDILFGVNVGPFDDPS
ncbi:MULTISPECIES: DUF2267 domain-containing protein [unclassified Nocardia]|uniref:DUF2267 domain-containing protein n=1 Tax=unclassified Nocardia TaxID=2637762 RepID=UPI001CE411A6|nr:MULTISPECIES: DUF2267 domain-containing protein [unclassified Nocardia]